jgi:PAS domain S-box-containing protein
VHDGIIAVDRNGLVKYWNNSAESLVGFASIEMVGRTLDDVLTRDCASSLLVEISRVSESRESIAIDSTWLHKDGRQVEVKLSLSPVANRFGHVTTISISALTRTQQTTKQFNHSPSSQRSSRHQGTQISIWDVGSSRNNASVEATAFFDGGSRGNPGPAGYGAYVIDGAGTVLAELSGAIGHATNNIAEYEGLIAALQWAVKAGVTTLQIKGDSQLLIEQMKGNYKVKNEGLKPLYLKARMLVMQIGDVTFEHVRREQNKDADRLSNVGMDGNA